MIDKFKKDKPPPRSIRFTRSRYFKNPNWDKEHEENAILHTYVDRWNTPADRRARLIGKAKRQRLQDIRDRYTGGPLDYGLGLGQYYGEQIVNWLRPGQALQQLPQTGPDVIPKESTSPNYHRSRFLYHTKPG
jgi:hypothetical protein